MDVCLQRLQPAPRPAWADRGSAKVHLWGDMAGDRHCQHHGDARDDAAMRLSSPGAGPGRSRPCSPRPSRAPTGRSLPREMSNTADERQARSSRAGKAANTFLKRTGLRNRPYAVGRHRCPLPARTLPSPPAPGHTSPSPLQAGGPPLHPFAPDTPAGRRPAPPSPVWRTAARPSRPCCRQSSAPAGSPRRTPPGAGGTRPLGRRRRRRRTNRERGPPRTAHQRG
jgi:hypothetical protein